MANGADLPPNPKRRYVAGKDMVSRLLILGQGHDHPALLARSVLLGEPNWLAGEVHLSTPNSGPEPQGPYSLNPVSCSAGTNRAAGRAQQALRAAQHRKHGIVNIMMGDNIGVVRGMDNVGLGKG
eukprot:scaffold57931_cov17-Tisochrysis_lutea.AAC.1